MQSLGRTTVYQPGCSPHHQLSRPLCQPARAAHRVPILRGRPAAVTGSTQHEVDELVAQPRRCQNSLGDVASTSSSDKPVALAAADAATPWYQRLGLPILKLAATATVVAALVRHATNFFLCIIALVPGILALHALHVSGPSCPKRGFLKGQALIMQVNGLQFINDFLLYNFALQICKICVWLWTHAWCS